MGNFYSRLSYSFGNEDWRTEQKALRIRPEDRVVCITASGDRPLNLLTTDFAELISVDANPMQNALFDLKRAAMKQLDYSEYASFLGLSPHPDRAHTYSKLEKDLSSASTALWKRHRKKISRGVIYEGAMEKFLKIGIYAMRPIRGKKIDRLFSFDDLDEQRAYLKSDWETYLWKKAFQIFLHPWLVRPIFKDPCLYEYVDRKRPIGDQVYDKVHHSLNRMLAKESILLSLILKGDVDREHFPPYLNEEGFEQIKQRLDRVKYETIDMASYLAKVPENSIDCFSCSDIVSYLSRSELDRLVKEILRTAKPGARFCMRQFLSNYQIPESVAPHFERDKSLEKELEEEDRCLVYRFMCGTIKK